MEDWELIAKYTKGDISKDEQGLIELWLKSDAANAILLEEIKATWASAGKLNAQVKFDKAKAWSSIQEKIRTEQKVIPITQKKSSYNTWILRVAAILVVGLFATWLMLKVNNKPELILVQTTDNEKMVVMPDSTFIYLNKNSTLIYPKEFAASERKVEMEGEAFFEVTKNPNKAFIIENKDFKVKVLGTSFNVKAFKTENEATVTVLTGKVAFTNINGIAQLLTKGEVGILNKLKNTIQKSTNLNSNFLAWKTKKLEFTNTNFEDVCTTLKKYFFVEINVKDKAILNCVFTGYFENPTLPAVLKVLEKTLNIKTVTIKNNVDITGTGC